MTDTSNDQFSSQFGAQFSTQLSLQVKGILVIALLLVFEIIFVGCHAFLLIEADRESLRQQKSKEIVSTAGQLLRIFFDAGDNVAKYATKRDGVALKKYQEKSSELTRKIIWIKEQLKKDSEQYRLFEKIETNVNSSLALFSQLKGMSENESELAVAQFGLKLRAKMRLELQEVTGDLVEFLNAEKKIESASPIAIKLQRERTRWLLAGGMLLNVVLAYLLVAWFLRSITSRLEVVQENAERLRQRKSLRVPLSGNDEIASIDEAFHEMSHSLEREENLLRASTEQIQTIIEQMPIGLVIIDESEQFAKVEYANPTLERLLDYKSGELVESALGSLFTSLGVRAEPLLDTSSVDGPLELLAHKKNGLQIPVELSVSEVYFESMSKRLATIIDISEKHEIEKMKEAFVAMVSHDLRTPLTSVAGFFHMLPLGVYGQFGSAIVDETKSAEKQVEELITLINDLLDLEKLKAGQLEMRATKSNLEDLLDSAVELAAPLAEELGVRILFDGCPTEISVDGDSDRLKQALVRVIVSAVRLSPNGTDSLSPMGTVRLEVKVELLESGERVVIIDLRVHGLQLSEDLLETIFEPFQAVNLNLGLALPLARAIINNSGGACGFADDEHDLVLWLQLPC
ncbi:hypothetical protein BH11CYA1_BH11CYA1_33280 [soil metagenome]